MKLKDKTILVILTLVSLGWLVHLISSILVPFICAIIIAYFLNPLANKIEKHRLLSRTSAVLIILGIFLLTIEVGIVLIVPILYNQLFDLVNTIPKYVKVFEQEIYPMFGGILNQLGIEKSQDIKSYLNGNAAQLLGLSNNMLDNIMRSSLTIINILSLVFVTPVLVFYILRDWALLVKKINQYLPSSYAVTIRRIFVDVDKTLSGYLRGQFNVCLILGLIYATGLSMSGLNFGFLIGFLTGIVSFIPYVGMLIGMTTALTIALFQWGINFSELGIVALIFFVGQVIESNFLTPKLVGEKIGLHPVWIIFGLFAFAALFGFIGILLAVPITAIIGVLAKSFAIQYKKKYVRR